MNQFSYEQQGAQSSQSPVPQPSTPEHLVRCTIAYLSVDGTGPAPTQMIPAKGQGAKIEKPRPWPKKLKLKFSVDVVHDVFKNLSRSDVYKAKCERIKEFAQIGGERAIDDLKELIQNADNIIVWIHAPYQHYCQRSEPTHPQVYCVTSPPEVQNRPAKWRSDNSNFDTFGTVWEESLKKALKSKDRSEDLPRVEVQILCDKTTKISHSNDAFREHLMNEPSWIKHMKEFDEDSEDGSKAKSKGSPGCIRPEELLQWLVVFNFVAYNEPKK